MIAALYVERGGSYYEVPDIDLWDEERDARQYLGPHRVVAHPPCGVWSLMGQCRPEIVRGADGGCFKCALHDVRTYGGVLEHPAHSHAWRAFGLPKPAPIGWTRSLVDDGWTCEIDQAQYGHRANKMTWLYYVGPEPPALKWGRAPFTGVNVRNDGGGHTRPDGSHGSRYQRSKTPPDFRDVLLELARGVYTKAEVAA